MNNNNRTEQWKTIKGYSEYEVSTKGRIRKLDGQELKQYINPQTGYVSVWLKSDSGESRAFLTHRVVAQAFIPNPNNLEQIDHKDADKTNNTVANLRWVSRKFNNSRKRTKMLKSANHRTTSHIHQFVKAEKDG